MSSNRQWTCNGEPKNPKYKNQGKPHLPRPVYDDVCIECGLPREAMISPTSDRGQSNAGLIFLLATGIVALAGFAAYSFWEKFSPNPPKPIPTNGDCIVKKPVQEPERFSSGDRTLFPHKGNLDRDRGIIEFNRGIVEFKSGNYKNYKQAAEFFAKAVDAARNDPEPRIYLNNARARLQGCPFTIAVVVPVDSKGTSAEEMLRGVADAQDKFNQAGGTGDRLLEILIVNDGNEKDAAERVARQIGQDLAILAVIGHNSSDASSAALPIYEDANLAMISPTSTSTSLQSKVFFRTVPSDSATGKALGEYAKNQLNINKLVIFYDSQSIYSKSLLWELKSAFPSAAIVEEIDLKTPDLDVKTKVKSSVKNGADTVVLLPSTDTTSVAIRIAKENAALQAGKMKLLGGDALYTPDTLIQGGPAVEGMILVIPLAPSQSYAEKAEQQWGGKINWRTASSFDAAQAVIQAIKALDSPQSATRQEVLEKLKSVQVETDTAGESWQFINGERDSEPYLVQAVKRDETIPGPKGSEFGFKRLQ
ncbi:MAG: ABC transporter substrate-binding protein [Xenococcaceae cyanobacterium]